MLAQPTVTLLNLSFFVVHATLSAANNLSLLEHVEPRPDIYYSQFAKDQLHDL